MTETKKYKILIPKEQGFILVTVLFFVFIMSLMTLSLLSSSYLELRMSQNWLIAVQRFQAAEAGLKLIEHRLATISTPRSALYEHYNYAGFQINAEFKQHKISYCINQKLAYVYDVIVQAKKMKTGALTLKTNYVINIKTACEHAEHTLSKTGRSSWRELNI